MPTRLLIGLAVGSGFEAAAAAAVRAEGVGLGMTPRVTAEGRVPLPATVREAGRRLVRQAERGPSGFGPGLAEALAQAARQAAVRAGGDLRTATAAGLLLPVPAAVADHLAERTGLTVVTGFRGRDVAAGGAGHLPTAAADALLFRDPSEDRLLVHLGSVTSALLVPAGGKLSAVAGFEAGPGNRFLDDLTALGTRGREPWDAGGTRAVQGRCLDDLLARWLAHPFLHRPPPKAIPRAAFGPDFLSAAFEAARAAGGTLHDLLCTATQFVARCLGIGCDRWLPGAARVLVSGGGVRNGYLWQRVEQQFPGRPMDRLDAVGVPAGLRAAAAAAVLAGLTLDGVAANLPLVTGAAGGRLVGRLVPGDTRNWAACVAWMAEQAGAAALVRAA